MINAIVTQRGGMSMAADGPTEISSAKCSYVNFNNDLMHLLFTNSTPFGQFCVFVLLENI